MDNELGTKDRLFVSPNKTKTSFKFDSEVADVFDDMIYRSVPGYALMIQQIGTWAKHFISANEVAYDLGCSLGAASISMALALKGTSCQLQAIDNSEAMINKCQDRVSTFKANHHNVPDITVFRNDLLEFQFEPCAFMVMNFTLQFIPPSKRLGLLQRMHHALKPQGALILSEKIVFENNQEQHHLSNIHLLFKSRNDYSDLEIAQKRLALENVLIPESLQTHVSRLQQVGFSEVYVWFQCFNFVSILAMK